MSHPLIFRWPAVILLALFGLALPGAAQAQSACRSLVASGNPQYPPYLWRDPDNEARLVGANAELMDWLGNELGVNIELRYVGNWARVQEEARAGRIDMIAGAFFTLPRTEYMDYAHLPFRETRSVVIQREGATFPYQRWEDLIPRRGLTVINNSFGQAFDRFASESLSLSKVSSLDQALQMLERGRADYLVYEDSPAEAFIARLGVRGLRLMPIPVAQEQLFVTVSHRSVCNTAELRGAISRAMFKLRQNRLMLSFVERGVQLWKEQERKSP
ncbi:substrate-binding periplasmic protein [Roseateles sp.]|jgi:polar amino acid transport system substrate-binding protein|uniref:substrate-binding periplasmic protein n=1 Tax=Roseateles sp. TaxID=1971397 RepID=UPI00391DF4DC